MKFITLIYYTIVEARPRQWIKNLAVFAALLFSEKLFDADHFVLTLKAFTVFCILSSFTYYLNDIRDKERDKGHPSKKNRPIAAGKISIRVALLVAAILLAFGLYWAYVLSEYFFVLSVSYVVLTTLYSMFLKHLAIIESITVAFGFVLRVMAGALIISVPISSWLTVCVISLALLISFGRRRSEITLMGFENASLHRPVLAKYPKQYLEVMISSLAGATFLSYTMFTFSYEPHTNLDVVMRSILPATLQDPKWMMLTVPIAFYSVARFLYLVYTKREKGEPEKLVTTDLPFLLSMIAWGVAVLLIIYMPS